MKQDKLAVTVKEMAKMLSIGQNKAYEMVNSEGFPRLQVGNKIIIPLEALREYLNNRTAV